MLIYGNEPSIKDHEHVRRAKLSSPDLAIEESMPACRNQAAFFANKWNKRLFIQLLSAHLRANQFFVDDDSHCTMCLNQGSQQGTCSRCRRYRYFGVTETMSDIYMMSEIAVLTNLFV